MRQFDSDYMRNIGRLSLHKRVENLHNKHLNNIDVYNQSPKRCKRCGKIIDYTHRRNNFCSKSCSASHNNLGVCHNPRKFSYKCSLCGCFIKRPCIDGMCQKCRLNTKFKYKASIGLEIASSTIRGYLVRTRGYKCEQCGLSVWNGKPIPLDSHHIDGNFLNNDDANLLLLCKNCHGQTDNYGAKNKGLGSERRRAWHKRLTTQIIDM